MRPALPAVVLAVCCVLAGCNSFAPGATGDQPAMPSVTPADVPQTGPDEIAPGLDDDRLTNASALFAAHQAALANRSVSVELRTTTRASNDSVLNEQVVEYRFGADRSRVAIDATGLQGSTRNVSLWFNESATLRRDSVGEDVRYTVRDRYGGYTPVTPIRQAFSATRDAPSWPVAAELLGMDDGVEVYRVTFEQLQRPLSFVVDERGLIRRVVQEDARTGVGSGREGVTSTTVTTVEADVGSVDRPGWVADAREAIADREYVAPGVTTDRVLDVYELVGAHQRITRNSSVTYVSERWTNSSNGSVLELDRTVAEVSADHSNYHVAEVRRGDRPPRRTERWVNASVGYWRETVGNRTNYDRAYGGDEYRVERPQLNGRLAGDETTLTELGDGRYRLVAEGIAAAAEMPSGGVQDPRVVVVFDERGFVSRVTQTYVQSEAGEERHVTRTTRYTDLGETTVERPDWLDAARNATS
ncbi:hypothetical protein ACFPYI_08070 [Halomarina salina]|uniref:Outer membrane lipoprotein-sorting protein n=1 Tax=Halomarina salina TaxID=1872699 RepID=A0ABD5RLJ0_9EURY|nr:hypothetical protein [Halomarina salina]